MCEHSHHFIIHFPVPSAKFCFLKLHPFAPWRINVRGMLCQWHFAMVSTWKRFHFLECVSLKQSLCAGLDWKSRKLPAGSVAGRCGFFSSHCERSPGSARPRQSCSKYANKLQSSLSAGAEASLGGQFIGRASRQGDFFLVGQKCLRFLWQQTGTCDVTIKRAQLK